MKYHKCQDRQYSWITRVDIISFFLSNEKGECANNQSTDVVLLLFKKDPPWGDIGFQQRIRSRLSVNSIKGGSFFYSPDTAS